VPVVSEPVVPVVPIVPVVPLPIVPVVPVWSVVPLAAVPVVPEPVDAEPIPLLPWFVEHAAIVSAAIPKVLIFANDIAVLLIGNARHCARSQAQSLM
jgi:hypothetical protein